MGLVRGRYKNKFFLFDFVFWKGAKGEGNPVSYFFVSLPVKSHGIGRALGFLFDVLMESVWDLVQDDLSFFTEKFIQKLGDFFLVGILFFGMAPLAVLEREIDVGVGFSCRMLLNEKALELI